MILCLKEQIYLHAALGVFLPPSGSIARIAWFISERQSVGWLPFATSTVPGMHSNQDQICFV